MPLDYELSGPPTAPVTIVLGGISATAHVCATLADPSPGWWGAQVGPGRAIDTRTQRVLGVAALDGGADATGRPARLVSTADQADAIAALLDELAIPRVEAIVGASYGGMTALAFGARHAARVGQLVVIGAAHEAHPMTTALRAVQREIVELGIVAGRAREALATARALAMTTYRSRREFQDRFTNHPAVVDGTLRFPVEEYLWANGERYAARTSAARFLALSLSADCHRVTPERITVPTSLVALADDAIVPRSQLVELRARLAAPSTFVDVATRYGHDAFLLETDAIAAAITQSLTFSRIAA
jgi:homoserine O-acetyltransferase